MIKKFKNNTMLVVISVALFILGAKNVVSAYRVADVPHTRYEIYHVMGTTTVNYSWRTIRYNRGYTYTTTRVRKDYGVNPAFLYTYHYNTY